MPFVAILMLVGLRIISRWVGRHGHVTPHVLFEVNSEHSTLVRCRGSFVALQRARGCIAICISAAVKTQFREMSTPDRWRA